MHRREAEPGSSFPFVKSIESLRSLVEASAPDEWYVTDGASAVGPVTIELLSRGVAAGRVPEDAFVRHVSWDAWRGLSDLTEHDPSFDPRRSFRMLPAVKIPRPDVPLVRESLPSIDLTDEIEEVEEPKPATKKPPRPPPSRSGPGPFDGATDLAEALLILLATIVEQCEVEGALVHRVQGDKAFVVCSHGPRMFEVLGDVLLQGDPVHFAARQHHTILSEPVSGVAGRSMKARLTRLGAPVEAAFMVPLFVDDKLLALVEAGRGKPFRGLDVAAAEKLVDLFVAAVSRSSWSRDWNPPAPRSTPGVKKP